MSVRIHFAPPKGQAWLRIVDGVDAFPVALVSAVAGAAAGSAATWWAQRHESRLQRQSATDRGVQDKLHQLELRIVRLEAESNAFTLAGQLSSRPEDLDA